MSKCDYPGCSGHLGKFDHCITEALWSSPGWEDESTGSTEWDVYAQLFLFPESGQTDRETTGMDYDVFIPARTFTIVLSDDRGFVWRQDYPTAVEAQNAFNTIDAAYSRWSCEHSAVAGMMVVSDEDLDTVAAVRGVTCEHCESVYSVTNGWEQAK